MAEVLDLVQGSPEWHAARLECFTASEAAAAMGFHKYMTREDLLKLKKTGVAPEVSSFQQKIFDDGHRVEAAQRAIIEAELGIDLYPVVLREGRYLASMDGMDELGLIGYEHKLWNEELAAFVREGELEPHYWIQLEQQIALSGVEKIIFVTSDGTPETREKLEYRAVPGRWEQIQSAWDQFAKDLETYVVPEVVAPVVAKAIMVLPALDISVKGELTRSNLDQFKVVAVERIAEISTDLNTDQDFADAEAAIKFLTEGEKRLALVEEQILGQMLPIDEAIKTLRFIREELMRAKRLTLEKTVKTRKDAIKAEVKRAALAEYTEHVNEIQARINKGQPFGHIAIKAPAIDIDGAMKNKRSIDSLRNAVNTELARAKVEATTEGNRVAQNVGLMIELCHRREELFADAPTLALKDKEAIEAIVKSRIADHVAREEAKRVAAELEAKRKADALAQEAIAKAQQHPQALEVAQPDMLTEVAGTFQRGVTIHEIGIGTDTAAAVPAATMISRRFDPPVTVRKGPPSRAEIVTAIACAFSVDESVADGWLKAITNPF